MSRVNGQMLTCDRCGVTTFVECTGEGERDGGYTRWNTFEAAPGWTNEWDKPKGGLLCPQCAKKREQLLADFWGEVAKR